MLAPYTKTDRSDCVEELEHWIKRHSDPQWIHIGLPAKEVEMGSAGPHHKAEKFLLPDGAFIIRDDVSEPVRFEPTTERERIGNRRTYLKKRYESTVKSFNTLKKALIWMQYDKRDRLCNPSDVEAFTWKQDKLGIEPVDDPNTPRGVESLLRLKAICNRLKPMLEKVTKQYNNLEDVVAERQAVEEKKQREKNNERSAEIFKRRQLAEIRKVEL